MVFLNYTAMQMTAKIVYYGPGLCGKTTNLQLDPRPHRSPLARRDGEPGDGGRPHALLRPPPARRGDHRRHEGPPPALHGARPGLLQRHPAAGAEGRRRCRVRGRQPGPGGGAERGVALQPPAEPRGARPRPARGAARLPVQQARPAQHPPDPEAAGVPQPRRRAVLRGGGGARRRGVRDAEGDLAPLSRLDPGEGRRGEALGHRRRREAGQGPGRHPAAPQRRSRRPPTPPRWSRSRSSSPRRTPTS